jgi:hypothetical protein
MNTIKQNGINESEIKKLPFSYWIKSCLSFHYISNLSIIVLIISYYMNAYELFFIFAPLVIVNFILIIYLMFNNLDDLMNALLLTYLPYKLEGTRNRDIYINKYKFEFIIFIIVWHLLPLFWLFYILEKENMVKLFRPNFMGMYLKSILIPILYYYYQVNDKIYGNINYIMYFIWYIILLLSSCIYLYLE